MAYPSSRYQNYSIFNGGVQVSVPSNWRQVNDGNSVWFVPEGAYGQYNGQAVYTHGASFGVAQTNNRNLQSATQELVNGLAQGNNNLRMNGGYQRTTLSGRTRFSRRLSNVNEATGRPENVRVITTQLRNGQLFYMIAVAPQNERNFENAFQTDPAIGANQRLSNKRIHRLHRSICVICGLSFRFLPQIFQFIDRCLIECLSACV